MKDVIQQLFYNKNLKFLIPFLVFIVGGSIGLQQFTSLRYKYENIERCNFRDEARKNGITVRESNETTLESQYEPMKKMDIEHWKNVRIPRPKYWNES
ncbi:cytochrome c oxidase assembly protein COX16 homolog, mitochondrial [Copidosoma floridanum]|uniref:cytochrome c oxidase assembly protein COX16 homolog, mitochondrial n=1 Tax=Copidosoma floridanum TaxID=29053 RepID=UPI0006C97936|nr:cytochrome c oxidase assembly protein COX16 homolog, mitochondrial [Copidosoma floridanum]